jgi:hypothetical protein
MNEELLKILSSYLFSMDVLPNNFVIEYVEDNKYGDYFKFNIDLSKIDLNSPNYNESYAKYFRKPKGLTGIQSFVYDWNKNMAFDVQEFIKVSGLKSIYTTIKVINEFYNYDYIEGIGNQIEEKIKETNYPNVKIDFERDTNPDVKIIFRNFKKEQWSYTQDFVKELKELLSPKIDLDSYIQAFTQAR